MSRPKAAILTIGGELLRGTVLNTNARFLGQKLTGLGFEVVEQVSSPDNLDILLGTFRRVFSLADIVIMSGGLGPTPDDLTRDAVAAYFKVPLEFSKKHYSFIQKYYKKRKKKIPAIVRKEAMFPANAVPLFNRFGIALGFYIETAGKLLVVLPGVPVELENMFESLVVPVIRKRFAKIPRLYPVIAKTSGISEPEVMEQLGKDFFSDPFDFGIYPGAGEVTLRLYADSKRVAERLLEKIRKRLGHAVYAYSESSLAEALGDKLIRLRKTLAVAESCTGGACSSEITKTSGSSAYFRGGITAYHADIKKKIGVSDAALRHGEVSAEVAEEMAREARRVFKADFGIGITGIAGPGGATLEKPVGLVYISVAGRQGAKVFRHEFWGDRGQVQLKSVRKALEHLFYFIG